MTISISDQTEKQFRKAVREDLGTEKGKLGSAADTAFRLWMEARKQKQFAAKGLALLERGFDMGKFKRVSRDELHERH